LKTRKSNYLLERLIVTARQQRRHGWPSGEGEGLAGAEQAPGAEQSAGWTGIGGTLAQIPMVAQSCFVFGATALPGQPNCACQRKALAPQRAEQMLVARDRVQGCERCAGHKWRIVRAAWDIAQPRPAWHRREAAGRCGDDSGAG
jgi:hypothetical protein